MNVRPARLSLLLVGAAGAAFAAEPPAETRSEPPAEDARRYGQRLFYGGGAVRIQDDGSELTVWEEVEPAEMVLRLPKEARAVLGDRIRAANEDRDPLPSQVAAMIGLLDGGPMFFQKPDSGDDDPFDPFVRVGNESERNLPEDIGKSNRFDAEGGNATFLLTLSRGNGWLVWQRMAIPRLPPGEELRMFGRVLRVAQQGRDVPERVIAFWTKMGVPDAAERVAAARAGRPAWATRTRENLRKTVSYAADGVGLEEAARGIAADAGVTFVLNRPFLAAAGINLDAADRSVAVEGASLFEAWVELLGEDRTRVAVTVFPYGTLGFSTYFHQEQPQPTDRLTATYPVPPDRRAEIAASLRDLLPGAEVGEAEGGLSVYALGSDHWVADAVVQAHLRPAPGVDPAEAAARMRRELADD